MNKLKLGVILCILVLCGCQGSTGNTKLAKLSTQDINTLFVKGQTTAEEVRAQLGDPSDVDFDNNGRKKWTYTHMHHALKATGYIPIVSSITSGTNDTWKKLIFIFDQHDKVLDQMVTQGKGETKIGILK